MRASDRRYLGGLLLLAVAGASAACGDNAVVGTRDGSTPLDGASSDSRIVDDARDVLVRDEAPEAAAEDTATEDTATDTPAADVVEDTQRSDGSDDATPFDGAVDADDAMAPSEAAVGDTRDAADGSDTSAAGDTSVGLDADLGDGAATVDDASPDAADASCPMGMVRCGTSATCVDTQSDPANCGACAMACPMGQVCTAGRCGCAAGATMCGGVCVDTQTASNHCGACGNVCPMGQVCAGGLCACGPGATLCGAGATAACVDASSDESNCGMCGRACGAAQTCISGACVCPTGTMACGTGAATSCVNVSNDNANCGACGNACTGGSSCVTGACVCPMGQTRCGSGATAACTDTQTDTTNCGACGTACPAGQVCSMGVCRANCMAPNVACGSGPTMTCANTQTDDQNCGACGTVCGTVPNSFGGVCTTGMCRPICTSGFANCNSMYADGCEVNTTNNLDHCGACGAVCPTTAANASGVTCIAGACRPSCNANRDNCNNNVADGCEVDLLTDANNCGACGNACGGGLPCINGVCGCTIDQLQCTVGGVPQCVPNNNANCGSCGNVCGVGTTCLSGTCRPTGSCAPTANCTGASCACTRSLFSEDWSSGTGNWVVLNGSAPMVTHSDASACTGPYLRETALASGGRVYTRNPIAVTAGRTYCLSSWIRGSANTQPFIGINDSNASGTIGAEHWLIGLCYATGFGDGPSTPPNPDGNWHWYGRQFVMGAATHVRLKLEIFVGGSAGTADFDNVELLEGPCPSSSPRTVCSNATCTP